MWNLIKRVLPPGNTNVLVTDKWGGYCMVRTTEEGMLPPHRYMMRTRDECYYCARTSITKWMQLGVLREILTPDKI